MTTAPCAAHPDRPALGTCARCGSFYCAEERTPVDGRAHCAACAARLGDWLEEFRRSLWGKRDASAWLAGAGVLLSLVVAANLAEHREALGATLALATAALQVAFFLGRRWARPALLLGWPLLLGVGLALVDGPAAILALLPLGLGLIVYGDTRSKLFFRVPVSRKALEKAWDLLANNPRARDGLLLSLLGLLLPPAAPAGLVLSAVGLSRVDPSARPPVGRRGQAVAGLALGALATLGWLVVIFGVAPFR